MTKGDNAALDELIGENCLTEYKDGWNAGFEAGKNAALRWFQRTTTALRKVEEEEYGDGQEQDDTERADQKVHE